MNAPKENFILYEDINTGKTTSLLQVVQSFSESTGGWLSPAVYSEKHSKVGYDLLFYNKGKHSPPIPLVRTVPFKSDNIKYGSFFFQK